MPEANLIDAYSYKMNIYQRLLKPLLFQMDPEDAHHLIVSLSRIAGPLLSAMPCALQYSDPDLRVNVAGVELRSPVGLAAGFDKNGKLPAVLSHFGFAFAEIGSVTAKPCLGNARPRLFRLPKDEAIVNRMGLNGDGAEVIAARLANNKFSLPIGLNIAKSNDPAVKGDAAIEDVLHTFSKIKDLPLLYVTINASCPNTKEGKLTEKEELAAIFAGIQQQNSFNLPILVKLSPDSSPDLLEAIVEDARKAGLYGYICGNTTVTRSNLRTSTQEIDAVGAGGLSGRPLKPLALSLCRQIWKLKDKEQVIIGVGGISSGEDAYEFIRSGVTAVQVYSGLVYVGPTLPKTINRQLSQLLKRDGVRLSEIVGADAD